MREIVTLVLGAGSIGGFIAYLVIRYFYARFLGEFGLKTQDLGLTHFDLVTASMATLLLGVGYSLLLMLTGLAWTIWQNVPWSVFLIWPVMAPRRCSSLGGTSSAGSSSD